jgi:hypothetical protein
MELARDLRRLPRCGGYADGFLGTAGPAEAASVNDLIGPTQAEPTGFPLHYSSKLAKHPVAKGTDRQLHRVCAMERFVRRQNVERYLKLLTTITEEDQRHKIMKLLSEERQKQKDAGDSSERIVMLTG